MRKPLLRYNLLPNGLELHPEGVFVQYKEARELEKVANHLRRHLVKALEREREYRTQIEKMKQELTEFD